LRQPFVADPRYFFHWTRESLYDAVATDDTFFLWANPHAWLAAIAPDTAALPNSRLDVWMYDRSRIRPWHRCLTPAPVSVMKASNNFFRLETRLQSQVGKAIADFNMIEDGDRILTCMSGGKDSYTMLSVLLALQKRAPIKFDIIAMNLDQKHPGFPAEVLPRYFESVGVPYRIVEADTHSIVKEKVPEGKTTCSLCSRLRRGVIYRTAKELKANKIALGHHRDDIVETFFLNLFFGGKMKAMPPKLATDDGQHIVIRPLAYCKESDIAAYARAMEYPIIPCDLCGSQENLQRKKVKDMLVQWERETPGRVDNVFRALSDVVPSHLADTRLFDFRALATGLAKIDEESLFGDTSYPQTALVFSHSSENRIEFVRNPGHATTAA
jgi:tRNA 2-thiocytidine biosynthesis protein TtcA